MECGGPRERPTYRASRADFSPDSAAKFRTTRLDRHTDTVLAPQGGRDLAFPLCSLEDADVRLGEGREQTLEAVGEGALDRLGEVDGEGDEEVAELGRRAVLRHPLALYAQHLPRLRHARALDGDRVPVRHFGLILQWTDWEELRAQLQDRGAHFVIEPKVRFQGKPGEQATMFVQGPSGNVLEFKAFRSEKDIFAR